MKISVVEIKEDSNEIIFSSEYGVAFGSWESEYSPEINQEYYVEFDFDIIKIEKIAEFKNGINSSDDFRHVQLDGRLEIDESGFYLRIGNSLTVIEDLDASFVDGDNVSLLCKGLKISDTNI